MPDMTKSMLEKVLELVSQFVVAKNGQWDHEQWETFLAKASRLGVQLTDENKRSLGNLLEASKCFYCDGGSCTPSAPAAKKKVPAKKKPAAKAKK